MRKNKVIWVTLGIWAGILLVVWANTAAVSAEPLLQISTPRPTITPIIEQPPSAMNGRPPRLHGSIFDWGKGFMPAGVYVTLRGDGWEMWSETDGEGVYRFYNIGNEVAVMNVNIPENRPDLRPLAIDAPVRTNAAGELIVNLALYPKDITPDPIVRVRVTASATQVRPGDQVSFDIVVQDVWNDGVHQVIVADLLPAGLSYVEATASQGEVVWDRGLVWATLGVLAPGESATVKIKATVAQDVADGTQIVNRVTAYNSENAAVQDQVTLQVSAPTQANPQDVASATETVELLPVTGIGAALPLAGLALFGVLLGVRRLRKRI